MAEFLSFPNSVWERLLLGNSVPVDTLERSGTSIRATELREGRGIPKLEFGNEEELSRGLNVSQERNETILPSTPE